MFKPIVKIEEDDEVVVYEYRTVYLWALYAIVLMTVVGCVAGIGVMSLVGCVLMVGYFLTVSTSYIFHGREIRRAARDGGLHFSGSKWSFKNPLRVTISKQG